MEQIAKQTLPDGFNFEWTTLAYQQLRAGNTAVFAFGLAVVFTPIFYVVSVWLAEHVRRRRSVAIAAAPAHPAE